MFEPGYLPAVSVSLESLDLATGEEHRLMSLPLGRTGTELAGAIWGGESTWRPDMQRGMARVGGPGCETLIWVTSYSAEYAPIIVSDGEIRWSLDDEFTKTGRGCVSNGRAMAADWSPDGTTIAFFGSGHAPGDDVWNVIDDDWNLYLMDGEGLAARPVLEGIFPDRSLAWSPDGRFLVFTGRVEGGGDGLWVYSVQDGMLRGVRDPSLWLADWSPDGASIASLRILGGAGGGVYAESEITVVTSGELAPPA